MACAQAIAVPDPEALEPPVAGSQAIAAPDPEALEPPLAGPLSNLVTIIGNYFCGAAGGLLLDALWQQEAGAILTCNTRLLTGYTTMFPFNTIPSAFLQLS